MRPPETRVETHAFGKVILLGEHAVVYGRPAIAAALPRGVHAVGEAGAERGPRLLVPAWGVDVAPGDDTDLAHAFGAVLAALGATGAGVRVTLTPEIPAGAGLGCSAALGVATARALAGALGRTLAVDEAIAASLEWERVIHGNPSGIDNTLAAAGGVGLYTRSEPLVPIVLPKPMPIAVGDTGTPGSTREMVAAVARHRERKPAAVDTVLDGIATIVQSGVRALEAADRVLLGRLFDLDQALLSSLLVSTSELEDLCAIAREAGAHGAKLTGGGGGGCVIAIGDRPDAIVAAWQRAGYAGFVATIGGAP
jgi:mevalonate kinase